MKTLSFTHQHRRSTKTLRLNYGLEGMKYIIQVYQREINGHGEKEGLPTEYQYEFEQEMLKHIHDLKKDSGRKDGLREIYQQNFITLHSSGVTNQMHSWGLSLSDMSLESCHYIVVTFVPKLLIGSLD